MPRINGSTRSLTAGMKTSLSFAILRSSPAQIVFRLCVEGARGEKFFDFHLARRQALLVGIARNRVEHGAIGFDAEGKRIVADQFASRGEIFLTEDQRRGNLFR